MRNPFKKATIPAPAAVHNRVVDLSSPTFAGLETQGYGGWAYRGLLGVPSVYRSVVLLSGLIGTLCLEAYRDAGGEDSLPAKIYPTPTALSDPSAGHDTAAAFFSSLVTDYLLEGNAIAVVAARNSQGWPTAFAQVPSSQVQVRYVNGGVAYNDPEKALYPIEYRIGQMTFSPADILHVKGGIFAPGALRGCGVLEHALSALQLAANLEAQAGAISQHGVPTGTLKAAAGSAVTPEQMTEAKEAWLQSQQTRTIAGLAPDIDFQAISWDPTQMQLLEARRFSTEQMCLLFGLPASMLNVSGGSYNYTNIGADGVALLKFTVDQILIRFEQALSQHLPRGTYAKFDRDAILATDQASRYAAYAIGLAGAPFLDVDEVRLAEKLPPMPKPPEPEPMPVPPTGVPGAADPNSEAEAGQAQAAPGVAATRAAMDERPIVVNIAMPEPQKPPVVNNYVQMPDQPTPNVTVNVPRSMPTVNVNRQVVKS